MRAPLATTAATRAPPFTQFGRDGTLGGLVIGPVAIVLPFAHHPVLAMIAIDRCCGRVRLPVGRGRG